MTVVGILGTGRMGVRLAEAFAKAGNRVILGSRDLRRAERIVQGLSVFGITAGTYDQAVRAEFILPAMFLRDGLITRAQYNAIVDAHRRKAAPPQYTKLGGLIYIHGNGAKSDWTLGCVALENEDMKELFDSVTVGTPIAIKP